MQGGTDRNRPAEEEARVAEDTALEPRRYAVRTRSRDTSKTNRQNQSNIEPVIGSADTSSSIRQ